MSEAPDPFALAPADEAQAPGLTVVDPAPFAEPPAEAVKKPAKKINKQEDTLSEPKVSVAKVTLKGGGGFDVPWIPLVFDSIAEAHASLTNPETQKQLAELFDVVARANTLFAQKVAAVSPPKPSSGGGAPARPGAEAPAGVAAAPGPDWTYKSGMSAKTGKAWTAWMPPRGSDAQPVWL